MTPFAVRGLNQPPHLMFIEPRHSATALPGRRELQRAPHLLDDITALIVREVMLAPQFGRLPEDLRHVLLGFRLRRLTTHSARIFGHDCPLWVLLCLAHFAVSSLCEVVRLPVNVVDHAPSIGARVMKQAWHPDELAQHWTLSDDECLLLGEKTGATRLRCAVLLKAFQCDGRFPERREDVAVCIVGFDNAGDIKFALAGHDPLMATQGGGLLTSAADGQYEFDALGNAVSRIANVPTGRPGNRQRKALKRRREMKKSGR